MARPSVAIANPSPVAGPYGPFIGLAVEALLIAIILGSRGFNPIRFFYSWGLVTAFTFLLLIGGFYVFDHLDRATGVIPDGGGIVLFFMAEGAIVFIEAIALWRLSQAKFFQRSQKEVAALTFPHAFNIAFMVNFVSFLFGI